MTNTKCLSWSLLFDDLHMTSPEKDDVYAYVEGEHIATSDCMYTYICVLNDGFNKIEIPPISLALFAGFCA